jgi:hypothetical protein
MVVDTGAVSRGVPCTLDFPERFFAAVMFAASCTDHRVEVSVSPTRSSSH